MILVDTSIWADHIDHSNQRLVDLLDTESVLMHPFVIGELALGNLRDRRVLTLLEAMPQASVASVSEVRHYIEAHKLAGTGIGYVDAHLLASTRLTPDTVLWTRDKRLSAAALRAGLAAEMPDEPP